MAGGAWPLARGLKAALFLISTGVERLALDFNTIIEYLEGGGARALITDPLHIEAALQGAPGVSRNPLYSRGIHPPKGVPG